MEEYNKRIGARQQGRREESGGCRMRDGIIFQKLYIKEVENWPFFESINWASISEHKANYLKRTFDEELKRAVWELGSDKALGPDSFL